MALKLRGKALVQIDNGEVVVDGAQFTSSDKSGHTEFEYRDRSDRFTLNISASGCDVGDLKLSRGGVY
jgi:hypothetical protein